MELTVSTFRPSSTLTYESPGTRRFFTVKAKRLVRLAHRIHDGRLFLPEIVKLVREAADELLRLGGFLLLTDKGSALLTELAWIKSPAFAPEGMTWDIREKERHRVTEPERCTLCRVKLVWPANIMWRRGLEIVSVSAPIGIQCATREAANKGWGKLRDLITEVRAIGNGTPPEEGPAEEANLPSDPNQPQPDHAEQNAPFDTTTPPSEPASATLAPQPAQSVSCNGTGSPAAQDQLRFAVAL